jgi:uncharacterized membrane protein
MKYLIAILAIGGVVVSLLAWRVHNSDPGMAEPCSINEHWDCGTVQHSRFAEIKLPPWGSAPIDGSPDPRPGIPVAAIGVAGYIAILILLVFDGRRSRQILFAAAIVGMGFALYLTYIEADVLLTWCLYCVISQGIITLILLASGVRLFFCKEKTA